mmetsp:Transcript_31783/g.64454  ORF Transcript_31783/g.64454 Transcript_31783/m.64454 type:complete len:268 (-) Transcript_31783:186-989(-)
MPSSSARVAATSVRLMMAGSSTSASPSALPLAPRSSCITVLPSGTPLLAEGGCGLGNGCVAVSSPCATCTSDWPDEGRVLLALRSELSDDVISLSVCPWLKDWTVASLDAGPGCTESVALNAFSTSGFDVSSISFRSLAGLLGDDEQRANPTARPADCTLVIGKADARRALSAARSLAFRLTSAAARAAVALRTDARRETADARREVAAGASFSFSLDSCWMCSCSCRRRSATSSHRFTRSSLFCVCARGVGLQPAGSARWNQRRWL